MKTVPQPLYSCYLEVLHQAILYARSSAWQEKSFEQIGDLMDAVHVIPELLQDWEGCNESGLFQYLEAYDKKYAGNPGDFSLTQVFRDTYERLTYPKPVDLRREETS